jgi:hypothetical protein
MTDALTASGLSEQWIWTVLSNDATLAGLVGTQIYPGVAPEGATYPMVTYQSLGGVDTTAPGFHRVITQVRYAIHCADRVDSIMGLDAIAARVDALLHGQTYPFSGGAFMVAAQRERQIVMSDQVAGVLIKDLVSTYLIVIQELGDI